MIQIIATTAVARMKPGTSGLLKRVAEFAAGAHLPNFVQAAFDAVRRLFASGFTLAGDAMHAVTGPWACAIFEGELGAAPGTVRRGAPPPDFGGHHPDPNLVRAKDLCT